MLRLQERKCRINALFSDATTGQTRERAYPFIQFLLTGLMTRRSAKRRKKWVDLSVLVGNTKYLAVCSKHFLDEDYSIMFSDLAKIYFQRRLRKDGIGICVFPTIRVPCFRWNLNQLKASEGDNKICIHVLRVVFDRATFAFRRKHVSFTYFAFVTVTWLSIVHYSKTIYFVSLYSEKERRFGKSGNLCTQRSKLASRTCGETS